MSEENAVISDTVEVASASEPIIESTTSEKSEVEANNDTSLKAESTETPEKSINTTVEDKPFIEGLTYKNQDELIKGFKEKDAEITRLRNEFKQKENSLKQYDEVIKKQGFESPQQFNDAQVEQAIEQECLNYLVNIENEFKHLYQGDLEYDIQEKMQRGEVFTLNDLVDGLSPKAAIEFNKKLEALEQYKAGKKSEIYNQREQQRIEQSKSYKDSLYAGNEKYKEILDLFFDDNPTPEKAFSLVENIKQQAIQEYLAEQKIAKENAKAKGNLQSTAQSSSINFSDDKHIFTRAELKTISQKDFDKNESRIMQQMVQGLIK